MLMTSTFNWVKASTSHEKFFCCRTTKTNLTLS